MEKYLKVLTLRELELAEEHGGVYLALVHSGQEGHSFECHMGD